MPKYRVTSPDGQTFEITAPKEASQEEVYQYVQENYKQESKLGPRDFSGQITKPQTDPKSFRETAQETTTLPPEIEARRKAHYNSMADEADALRANPENSISGAPTNSKVPDYLKRPEKKYPDYSKLKPVDVSIMKLAGGLAPLNARDKFNILNPFNESDLDELMSGSMAYKAWSGVMDRYNKEFGGIMQLVDEQYSDTMSASKAAKMKRTGGGLLTDPQDEIDWKGAFNNLVENPRTTVSGVLNALMADPEFVFTPIGWKRAAAAGFLKTAKYGNAVRNTVGFASGLAGAGALGAAQFGALSMAGELSEEEVDWHKVFRDAKIGAAGGAGAGLIGNAFKLSGLTGAAALAKEKPGLITIQADALKSMRKWAEEGHISKKILEKLRDKYPDTRNIDPKVLNEAINQTMDGIKKQPVINPRYEGGIDFDQGAAFQGMTSKGASRSAKGFPGQEVPSIDFEPTIFKMADWAKGPLNKNPKTGKPYKDPRAIRRHYARYLKSKLNIEEQQKNFMYDAPRAFKGSRVVTERELQETLTEMKPGPVRDNALKAIRTKQQGGRIDPKLLAGGGALSAGAIALTAVDERTATNAMKFAATVGGGMLAAKVLPKILAPVDDAVRGVAKWSYKWKTGKERYTGLDEVSEALGEINALHAKTIRQIKKGSAAIRATVNNNEDALRGIYPFIEENMVDELPFPELKALAKEFSKQMDDLGKYAKEEGVLDDLLNNYVPHLWRAKGMISTRDKVNSIIQEALDNPSVSSMSTSTKHNLARKLYSIQLGRHVTKGKLEPVTTNLADIFEIYAMDVTKALINKQAKNILKNVKVEGQPLMLPSKKAPANYRSLGHPAVEGYRFHPDARQPLRHLFYNDDPNIVARAALSLNFLAKRMAVSTSLFHANALVESYIMATGDIPKALRIAMPFTKKKGLLEQLQNPKGSTVAMLKANGQLNDYIDDAIDAGLMVGGVEDVLGVTDTFYKSLHAVENVMDNLPIVKKVPGVKNIPGGAVRKFENLNRNIDAYMWDRVMTWTKLEAYAFNLERLKTAFPTTPLPQLRKYAAEYVNDAFGGLNWSKLAGNMRSKAGQKIVYSLTAPSSRRAGQFFIFAPDWTTANIRVIGKAIPGVASSRELAYLHRQYAARGAMMWLVGVDALHLALTGEHAEMDELLSGKILLPGGRYIVASKQFSEPFDWVTDFSKTALNKAGVGFKMPVETFMGLDYLSPGASAPRLEGAGDRFLHALGKYTPISSQQEDALGAATSFVGHPVRKINSNNDLTKIPDTIKKLREVK